MVVGEEQKDAIRSHIDLDRDNAKFSKKACRVCAVLFLPLTSLLSSPLFLGCYRMFSGKLHVVHMYSVKEVSLLCSGRVLNV